MKLHVLFAQPTELYEGQRAPEVLECWDEYSIDENHEGWVEACTKAIKCRGGLEEFSSAVVIIVEVNDITIDQLLNETPTIDGKVVTDGSSI